ncbi:MAG: hypothetical protein L3J10_09230 [Sulfurimonas sp.]|nr:hypothetical protein [Sulfurimonas sp.]
MILKLLLVISVIAIVYFFFIKKKPTINNSNNNPQKDDIKNNDMVECHHCKIYCEISEAILSDAKYYCSNECLEKN